MSAPADGGEPLRVALVHPYPWPEVRRGAERYLEDLSVYLAGDGHDVTVVTGTSDGASRLVRPDGVTVVRCPHPHVRGAGRLALSEVDLFGLAALPRLRALGADVVHSFVPSGALAGRLSGRPTLYTVLGHPTADQLPAAALPRWLFVAAARRATRTATLSEASADALAASVGRRAQVLPPGIRSERFPPETGPRTGAPVVLFSASLADPRKRAGLAIDAFVLLRARHPAARLVLSGEGDPGALLAGVPPAARDAVEAPGVGSPDDVPRRYRDATVTVLPADHEAFGLALVESLASGTPVVCTPSGGMPEIVDGPVGAVASASTPEALADALDAAIALAGDPATARRCVDRAGRWDWAQRVGPAHLATYRALLSPTGAGRPRRAGAP